MHKIIIMTEFEFKNLLEEFIKAWMDYQKKGYGNTIISNETGDKITTHDGIGGAFMLPWAEVFDLNKIKD